MNPFTTWQLLLIEPDDRLAGIVAAPLASTWSVRIAAHVEEAIEVASDAPRTVLVLGPTLVGDPTAFDVLRDRLAGHPIIELDGWWAARLRASVESVDHELQQLLVWSA